MDELETGEQLALVRWGMRFARTDAEQAYRRWHCGKAVPMLRVGQISSILNWLLALAVIWRIAPGPFWAFSAWVLFTIIPLSCLALAVTYGHRSVWGRWIFPMSALANAVGGLLAVGAAFWLFNRPDVAMATTAVVAFIACTVLQLRPMTATFAIIPYLVLDQVLLVHWFLAGRIGVADFGWYLLIPAIALLPCLLASISGDRISRESFRQERIIDAQRRAIERERARADGLLRNVLPGPIAERLKREPARIADHFSAVTVLFGDIAGFTPISATLSPQELVAALDDVFSAFDDIAERLGLEKIKTIGDAYMVVGGVPVPDARHAHAVAQMALEMRETLAKMEFAGGRRLAMRIGLHTGEVVAGVIGKRKFSYDLWGDTVNTASRMESHGAPGEIQVSESTREALGDAFVLEQRGTIEVKGKGPMRTWWLRAQAVAPPGVQVA